MVTRTGLPNHQLSLQPNINTKTKIIHRLQPNAARSLSSCLAFSNTTPIMPTSTAASTLLRLHKIK